MSCDILEVKRFENYNLTDIVTPLNVEKFKQLLEESKYEAEESQFLIDGFTNGFDIGYRGPTTRQSKSKNIPFTPGVGDKTDMWNKIMKEVEAKRVAGPFKEIPFENYIQSPIGLVPKAGGKTRLIFHLSYNFDKQGSEAEQSVNTGTPKEDCTVKYNDLDQAIRICLRVSQDAMKERQTSQVFLGKTDLSSAFRVLPLKICCICWLIMCAQDPESGEWFYFIDKCLPFGASISCSHYQRFSNALRHVMEFKSGTKNINNYLDDFLFAAITKLLCNALISQFLQLCSELSLLVAADKTEWATTLIVFLGILLDGTRLVLCIPLEKQEKALKLLNNLQGRKKATIKQLQTLTGYLNFLTRAIHPG